MKNKDIENSNESFIDLISQATQMLLDRPKIEQDLIYFISKLDNEERAAIILAYEYIHINKE